MTCGALSERDRNPRDRLVPPTRERSLIRTNGRAPIAFGFNDSAFVAGQIDLATTLRLHEQAGSTVWRLPLDWGTVERTRGQFDFSAMDEIYCRAVNRGIRPLVHLTGIPNWAAESNSPCMERQCIQPPAPAYLPNLTAFAERVAVRYPGLAAIEAWNEPNNRAFWPEPDPRAYVGVLAAVYEGVKAGNPQVPVLGGALSTGSKDNPAVGRVSLQTFLRGMARAGAGRHMDGLSLHPYPRQDLSAAGDLFGAAIETARRFTRVRPGWTDRLWVTETGIATVRGSGFSAPVSEHEQERTLRAIFTRLVSANDVDAVLFHTLIDPRPPIPGGPGFGWLTSPAAGLRAKPVFCAFSRAFGRGDDGSSPAACRGARPAPRSPRGRRGAGRSGSRR